MLIDVDDLVDGIYKLLYSDYHLPVNLGNPDEVSILEFAREIIKVSKLNLGIVFESLPEDDPNRRKAQEGREQANLLCHSLGRRCCGVYGAQRAEAHAAELLSHAGRNPSRFSSGGESAEEGGMRLIFSSAAFSAMLRARHKKACALCAVIVRVSNVHRCG